MADKEDITAAQELAKAATIVAEKMTSVSRAFQDSTRMSIELGDAMKEVYGKTKDSSEELKIELGQTQKSMSDLEKEAQKTRFQFESFQDVFDHFLKKAKSASPIIAGGVVGGLSGMAQGFKNILANAKSIIGFMTNLAQTATNVGLAILAIPFKLFNTLVDMAEKGAGGIELAQAYEEVRKEFGSFKSVVAQTVFSVNKQIGQMNETGLSAWRVYGDLAERLKYVTQFAKAMGAAFQVLAPEFMKNGKAVLDYQKGLGIADEEMKALGERAISMGEDMSKSLNEITKYTLQFNGGVVNKQFSRDMAKAMADVKHFGGATVKEIGRATAYAKSLGKELKEIVGVMDAFNTFDTAAENAAKLSQAFGMTVDSFKMVKAQSPDEMLDHLRDSFKKTGKSVKDFSRQDFQLMAQTTGLSEDVARLAMSEKNRGKSLKELEKESERAKNKQLSQAEAMKKIADAIERLVKQMELSGGFWDMFVKGIKMGLQHSAPFWKLMMNIRKALATVYMEGYKLGKWIMGPSGLKGFQEFVGAVADFFDPGKFQAMFSKIADVFKKAVTDLVSGKMSFGQLMDTLKKTFFDFFDSQSGPGKTMLSKIARAMDIVVKLVSEGVKWASDKLVEGLKWITDLIAGRKSLSGMMSAGGQGANVFLKMFKPLLDTLTEKVWPPLWKAIQDLSAEVWKKLKEYFKSGKFQALIKPVLPYLVIAVFGPALLRGMVGAFGGLIVQAIGRAMSSKATEKALEKSILKATEKMGDAAEKMSKGPAAGAKKMGGFFKAVAGDLVGAIRIIGNLKAKEILNFAKNAAMLGVALLAGGVALAGATWVIVKILGTLSTEAIVKSLGAMLVTVMLMVPLVMAARMVGKMGKGAIQNMAIGMTVIVGAFALTGLVATGLAALMGLINPSKLVAAGDFMLAMSKVFLMMVPLVLAATAIGFALISAGGLGTLAIIGAAVAGMAALTAAVTAVSSAAVLIVKELSQMTVAAGMQEKLDVFLKVVNVMKVFSDMFIKVIDASTPAWYELTNRSDKFQKSITSASNAMKTMANATADMAKTILDGIVSKFTGGGMSPDEIKKAEVMSGVLAAVTTAIQAMQPPDALVEAGSGTLITLLSEGNGIARVMDQARQWMQTMEDKLVGFVNTLVREVLPKILGIPLPKDEELKKVTQVMDMSSKLMDVIKPANMESFNKLDVGAGTKGVNSLAIQEYFRDVQNTFVAIMNKATYFIKDMMTIAREIKPAEVQQVELVIKMVDQILKIVSGLSGAISNMPKLTETFTAADKAVTVKESMVKMGPAIQEMAKSVAEFLPGVISSMATLGKSITPAAVSSIAKAAGIQAGVVNALTAATKIVQAANDLDKTLADGNLNKIDIQAKLQNVANAVGLKGAKYTIDNKMVQVTVNLTVVMKTDEVEKVIVHAPNSIIRDRLNSIPGLTKDGTEEQFRIKPGIDSPVTPINNKGAA